MKLTAQQLIEGLRNIADDSVIAGASDNIDQAIEAVKALQQIQENGKSGKWDGWYCSDIAKQVFHE